MKMANEWYHDWNADKFQDKFDNYILEFDGSVKIDSRRYDLTCISNSLYQPYAYFTYGTKRYADWKWLVQYLSSVKSVQEPYDVRNSEIDPVDKEYTIKTGRFIRYHWTTLSFHSSGDFVGAMQSWDRMRKQKTQGCLRVLLREDEMGKAYRVIRHEVMDSDGSLAGLE